MEPESYFRIRFITDSAADMVYDRLLSLLNKDEELPEYFVPGGYSCMISGDTMKYGLHVDDDELHPLDRDDAVVSLDILCSDIVADQHTGQDRLKNSFGLVRRFYEEIDAQYVFGMHSERIETIGLSENRNGILSPINEDSLAQNRIVASTWLMLFPPAMVEEYDREWLLDLPAARIDELDDGAIMIVATTDIFDAESDLEIANAVGDGLRPLEDAFAEKHRS